MACLNEKKEYFMFTPEEYKAKLALKNYDEDVLMAGSLDTPAWVLEELGKNSLDPRVQEILASSEVISFSLFQRLVDSENLSILLELSQNPALPASIGIELLKKFIDPKTGKLSPQGLVHLEDICANSDFSLTELLDYITENHLITETIKRTLVINRSLPVRELNRILRMTPGESQYSIFYSVLSKTELDPSTLETIMDVSGHIYILEKVANHSSILGRILEKLYIQSKGEDIVVNAIASNPVTPPELLEELALSPKTLIVSSVAHNASASVKTLRAINDRYKDKMDANIARSLALNHGTPIDILEEIASYKQTSGDVIRNPFATYKCLQNVNYDYLSLQASIALVSSPLLTTELISRFLFSRAEGIAYPEVIEAFIYHPLTSFEDKYTLAFKKNHTVARKSLFIKENRTYSLFIEKVKQEHNIDISSLTEEMVYDFFGWEIE
jgi:hypothetical protein